MMLAILLGTYLIGFLTLLWCLWSVVDREIKESNAWIKRSREKRGA